ncbi:MAG TPA: aspartate aminotransferase family protein, partial [Rhodobacteraceae bacterium]|nr:aspartate aminotransferase family protein [Paracoccaceae bacterium]
FAAETGTAGLIGRERAFANGLVMRHVRDSLIISPPLVITKAEIDTLIDRAARVLDETHAELQAQGLMVAGARP